VIQQASAQISNPQPAFKIETILVPLDFCRASMEALDYAVSLSKHFGKEAVSIGFTTYDGTVTAASDWDTPAERKNVRPAHQESYEALFHDVDVPNFYINLRRNDISAALRAERLKRAIGVIYRPETELLSHYFHARLPDQSDAILHYDHTRAVEPLERSAEWEMGEVEETFPSGL
jgi:erythromycin esterase-like protein